ncbi:hypothetical protein GCM10025857_17030 [Alicyclobacillus contaminans]|nr:hypothetical protein GCM10025857_17030 [Alicyclobacillus contaminans]
MELIRKIGLEGGDIDFLREGLKVLTEAVMDAEVSQLSVLNALNEAISAGITATGTDEHGTRGLEPLNCKFPSSGRAVISPAC